MAAVAKQLGMSERSFKRYLAHEGTTFGKIPTVYGTELLFVISKIGV
jgi:hypothetical protein